MRVAVIDMGTNSTRLLVADAATNDLTELERRSTVTRLGRGVDVSNRLADEAIADVCDTVGDYLSLAAELEPERTVAVATSAVRDADNGSAFIAELRERFALGARVLDGDEEARLIYTGAVAGRGAGESGDGATLVVDIGGGSTELVAGRGDEVGFHVSLQVGVVRHTERHLQTDPPRQSELESLARDVQRRIDAARIPEDLRITRALATAGTPSSLAAIDQRLVEPSKSDTHGYSLERDRIQRICSSLATKSLDERLRVTGLIPGRAPTIVAGVVILIQVMRAFGLEEIEVSEHDILWGAALEAAA
ncbi:Ppx/GppA family phosphatase [Thermoleophilia bacterium SCSIO 60948]|nr:Ppx/GppA family phosphatase [Thermoleophilia bacterium SCSIO 60948]